MTILECMILFRNMTGMFKKASWLLEFKKNKKNKRMWKDSRFCPLAPDVNGSGMSDPMSRPEPFPTGPDPQPVQQQQQFSFKGLPFHFICRSFILFPEDEQKNNELLEKNLKKHFL